VLHELAEELPGPESEVVALRVAALAGGDAAAAARRQAEIVEHDLVLLCGPVATWRRKSSETFHGMMASVPLPYWIDLLERASASHAAGGPGPPLQDRPDGPLAPSRLWCRGHDSGDQLRLPQTALRELHVVGREASIALQEAFADTIGYLAVAGGPWPS